MNTKIKKTKTKKALQVNKTNTKFSLEYLDKMQALMEDVYNIEKGQKADIKVKVNRLFDNLKFDNVFKITTDVSKELNKDNVVKLRKPAWDLTKGGK